MVFQVGPKYILCCIAKAVYVRCSYADEVHAVRMRREAAFGYA
jgi:hypothetical protein